MLYLMASYSLKLAEAYSKQGGFFMFFFLNMQDCEKLFDI